MSDKKDDDICPYCSAMLFMGHGMRTIARELYATKEEQQRAIIAATLKIQDAVDVLICACKSRNDTDEVEDPSSIDDAWKPPKMLN